MLLGLVYIDQRRQCSDLSIATRKLLRECAKDQLVRELEKVHLPGVSEDGTAVVEFGCIFGMESRQDARY